ncbi:hypothetical protein [Paracoccus sp. S4493]|uniref:hypothetical protein n=1 Tax=Paracoccus sp. S4493 TaxID=579490 RepID=UPI0012ED9971|nr:hypothetical protein [Paracoccus sp. S4493]
MKNELTVDEVKASITRQIHAGHPKGIDDYDYAELARLRVNEGGHTVSVAYDIIEGAKKSGRRDIYMFADDEGLSDEDPGGYVFEKSGRFEVGRVDEESCCGGDGIVVALLDAPDDLEKVAHALVEMTDKLFELTEE